MGHRSSKKQAAAAAKKASSSSGVRQEQSKTTSTEPFEYYSIMTECKPAFDALQLGETHKALKILEKVCLQHESSAALVHHIQSCVYFRRSKIFYLDDHGKQMQLWSAIAESNQAVLLSPNSIQFAFHYARMLYEAERYEKAEQECERALLIRNPIDLIHIPREDRLYNDFATARERIAYVKKELQELLDKSKTEPARRKEEQEAKMAEEERWKEK